MSDIKKKKEKSQEILLLAKRIRELRHRTHSSYEIFAYDNNITRSQWGRYETGEDVRFSSLVKVCRIFNITLQEFFSEGFENVKNDILNNDILIK
jgi:transcriptional regulator with XRE-family HTH domain